MGPSDNRTADTKRPWPRKVRMYQNERPPRSVPRSRRVAHKGCKHRGCGCKRVGQEKWRLGTVKLGRSCEFRKGEIPESRWTVRPGRVAIRFLQFALGKQRVFRIGLRARPAFGQRHDLLFVCIAAFATPVTRSTWRRRWHRWLSCYLCAGTTDEVVAKPGRSTP